MYTNMQINHIGIKYKVYKVSKSMPDFGEILGGFGLCPSSPSSQVCSYSLLKSSSDMLLSSAAAFFALLAFCISCFSFFT